MAGSSRSILSIIGANLRVAAIPTYYPAYAKNGQNVSQKISFRALANFGTKDPNVTKQIPMNITAWGKLADVLARSMSKGKEFSATFKLNVYQGRVYVDGQQLNMNTPQGLKPVMTEKVGFQIEDLAFGSESAKFIADDIGAGNRPVGWDQAGTPAAEAWKVMRDKRKNEQYDPSKATFGFAKVVKIEGPGITAPVPEQRQAAPAPMVVGAPVSTAAAVAAAVAAATPAPAQAPLAIVKGL
jgi:hypothetical protein